MQEQKREFTGVWIPRHIIEDEDLSMTEKIIFAEIACFEICYKSNESLGKRYSLKADTIVRIISKLVKKGYIERASFDGRNRQLIAKMDKPNPMQTRKKILPCLGIKSYADQEKNPTIDNTLEHRVENNIAFAKSKRSEVFKKEDYDEIIATFEALKGVKYSGSEYLPIQQAIKSMFLDGRKKEDIIALMRTLNGSSLDHWQLWTMQTVKKQLPLFLSGSLKF